MKVEPITVQVSETLEYEQVNVVVDETLTVISALPAELVIPVLNEEKKKKFKI